MWKEVKCSEIPFDTLGFRNRLDFERFQDEISRVAIIDPHLGHDNEMRDNLCSKSLETVVLR